MIIGGFEGFKSLACNTAQKWSFPLRISSVTWPNPVAQPENFQGRGGFGGLGHFSKLFVKNASFRAFSPRYS